MVSCVSVPASASVASFLKFTFCRHLFLLVPVSFSLYFMYQGNIRVYVRVRPPTIEDTAAEAKVMAPEHHHSSGINDPSHVRVATSFFEDEPELIEVRLICSHLKWWILAVCRSTILNDFFAYAFFIFQ